MNFHLPKSILLLLITGLVAINSFAQPGNNNISAATTIVSDSTCKAGGSMLTSQNLYNATYVSTQINTGALSSACTFVASQDVWYKFVAKSQYPNIALSNLGADWGNTGSSPKIQVYSGTVVVNTGTLTEVACANNNPITPTPLNTPLTVGSTYYVRVSKNNTNAFSGSNTNFAFDICITDQISKVSRMNEIFSRTYLSGAGVLNYPWEVTYGPDDSLWITEARGYKVSKMSTIDGGKRTVLDLSFGSTWLSTSGFAGADTLDAQQSVASWNANANGWPQGGFAGLALHPNFGKGTNQDFVYVTYVWKYVSGTNADGVFYQNKLVRFTYSNVSKKLGSPAVLDWNLPGSNDHNSQRLVVAPVVKNGTPYLFMGQGDLGAGQFYNRYRKNKAQDSSSYEGKILRYNLEADADPGYAAWIPNDNPYTAGTVNAVWSIGIRNNQGFAYDTATNTLYGSSHGPYSDDEINIIEKQKNYGHPRVIGYAADGNYNGNATAGTNMSVSAGTPYADCDVTWYIPASPVYTPPAGNGYTFPYCGQSSLAPIGNELNNANAMRNVSGVQNYKDPLFSAYPTAPATILSTWQTNPGNGGWESEAWSGLDLYSNKLIPGWNRSLVAAGLKWGRIIKLNLDATGTKTIPSNIGGAVGNASDTVTYFQSSNRYRDLAFGPNGKDIYLVMDNSSATSGPGTSNPTAAGCPGCVVKYTFLGYADPASGFSSIPKTIGITTGATNTCNAGTTITIDASNNLLWVPITGPDGNILAEIYANGNNLGAVTSSFYINSGAIRVKSGLHYLDRNITITPTVQPLASKPVKVRLYLSTAEYNALKADPLSNVTAITDLKILKNNDICSNAISSTAFPQTLTNANNVPELTQGANGYVLQTSITGFSTFYIANSSSVLASDAITFTGTLQNDLSVLLSWRTDNEINTNHFELERSTDGNNFKQINYKTAAGNSNTTINYAYNDKEATGQEVTTLYYRLKTVSSNGSIKYSNIVRIILPTTKALITIAPNPVSNDIKGNILSASNGNATMRIYDNTGRVISQTNIVVKKGYTNFTQSVNKLSSGAYYVEIIGDTINSKTKFQKL